MRIPACPRSNGRVARKRTAQSPKDADAHYQLGAAVGLRASYTATVEGSVMGAFRAAREAYEEHETVLTLGEPAISIEARLSQQLREQRALCLPKRAVKRLIAFERAL